MNWIEPKRLASGMTIGIMAPASASDEDLHRIEEICNLRGYKVLFGESAHRKGLYGGTPEEQAREFQYMMTTAPCEAVLALRGGYGTMRYLDLLDYTAIRKHRKAFIGYSDCTALHMAINRYSRLITYHGPMGVDFKLERKADIDALFNTLEGKLQVIEPLPEPPRGAIGTELGEGILRGGNMTMLSMLSGTPYFLEDASWEDTLLFIEDVGEAPYKLDRMLQQGYEALRYMEENRDPELLEPFVCYVPTGHGTPHQTLPLGAMINFRYISNTIIVHPYTK
ncbi:MAG: LD-carboxypeptidase [Veillonella sp.]|nr:LD-carboxypeptidase [Veillonella sp.]